MATLVDAVAAGLGVGLALGGGPRNGRLEVRQQIDVGLAGANQSVAAIHQQATAVTHESRHPQIGAAIGLDHAAHHHAAALEGFAQRLADRLGLILLRVPQRINRAHAIDQAASAPDGFAGLLGRRGLALGEVVGNDHRSAGAGGQCGEPRADELRVLRYVQIQHAQRLQRIEDDQSQTGQRGQLLLQRQPRRRG
ncbi:hypothetical protein D9M71_553260 [compost metagenome]